MRRSIVVLAVIAVVVGLAGSTLAPAAVAQSESDRFSEPIIIGGAQLGVYQGLPVGEIGVWVYDGARWERVASQLDQRDAADAFVVDDGRNVLDRNDELVFMFDDLGEPWPGGELPPGVSREPEPAHVIVADPLSATYEGHAYVYHGQPGSHTPSVTFDPTTLEISSSQYIMGLASALGDGFFGLKRLSLMGGSENRLDRSKISITIPQFGSFNEETLAQFGGLMPTEPVVEGPVRLIFSQDGASVAYIARATLFSMQLDAEIPLIPGLEFRVSLDFSPNAVGATYTTESLRDGVTIDGQPDSMLQFTFPMWRQIEFDEGRLVLLTKSQPTPLLVRPYYKDDSTPNDEDTGDKMSYGDNGIVANTFDGLLDAGFLGQMVVLPPEGGPTADDLAKHLANPLSIEVDVAPAVTLIYLPLAIK